MNLSMSRLSKLSAMIRKNPKFVMMRVPGRFRWVKTAAKFAYNLSHKTQRDQLQKSLHERRQNSAFSDVDIKRFTTELKQHGVAFGLTLPAVTVDAISRYAEQAPCYADRNPSHGFLLSQRTQAETALDKPILLAQYMNTASECSDIRTLADDPVLRLIAAEYLGGLPKLVGTSLWWTFPVDASEHDRMNHAHFFHSDVDDFAFVKFFFYLTDVAPGDGSHVCVPRSHHKRPHARFSDRWKIRRYTDAEIKASMEPRASWIFRAKRVRVLPKIRFACTKALRPNTSHDCCCRSNLHYLTTETSTMKCLLLAWAGYCDTYARLSA